MVCPATVCVCDSEKALSMPSDERTAASGLDVSVGPEAPSSC
jgi:hypothetical protein